MKKVLVINSSARRAGSHSRRLTKVFVDHWKSTHIDSVVRYRELGNADVPHINERWITAAFVSRGTAGYEKGEFHEFLNFQSTYLKAVFTIMGVSDIHVVAINGTSSGAEKIKKCIDAAHRTMRDLIETE